MTENTDWASAIAILTAGLILGLMFIYFVARRRSATPPADLELRDLEAKRDLLIDQLRAEVDPDERTRLERETAQVLRAIDERTSKVRPSAAAAAAGSPAKERVPVTPRNAMLIGFAWGVGSVLVLGGLAYFVSKAAKPREGAEQQQAMQRPAQADPIVGQLEAIVAQSPDNLEARINLAQAYLERDNLMGVFEQTQYVLTKNPRDARALTYQALVRTAMGQQAESVQMLQEATKIDPMLLDAWVGLAWVHTQSGKTKEAEAAMAEAIRRRPEEKQRLEQVLAEMKAQLAGGMAQTQQLPPDHPPVAPPPTAGAMPAAASAPPASAGGSVRITLDLDPAAKGRTGTIYVIARPAGVSGGPPVAVKRVPATSLPVTFDFSSADSMMGQPLPASMRIEARLDADGDAATRSPSDPSASQDGVKTGSTLKLALK
ncbi:MAG TPA: tetratricopeptide repeat protein [Thermoanaerobaculia bacterium]|nr:tetratricopeptide repeat protein [Thermoanaerobaculia bacterium]